MNLADLPYCDLMKIKEVGLAIRDIAIHNAMSFHPMESIERKSNIIRNDKFTVKYIGSSVALIQPSHDIGTAWSSFSFAVNTSEASDKRVWSTRLQEDTKRYCIRESTDNKILLVDKHKAFFCTPQSDDRYLETLSEYDDFENMQAELFQKSLVLNTNEMNTLILNYIFRKEFNSVLYTIMIGYTDNVHLMLEAHEYIEELRNVILPQN